MKKFAKFLGVVLGVFLIVGCDVEKKDNVAEKDEQLKIGQVQYAAHGNKSFASTTVVMQGDKIAMAYINEYQYMKKEGTTCVPNTDGEFGTGVADQTKCLASKRENNEAYSQNMKTNGNATKTLLEGYTTIEEFVKGKTIDELEDVTVGKQPTEVVDTVAGATLVDTQGYINSIIEAAKIAK